ncbi:MAG: response regulator, partial [Spirochaetales bacterium]|nr:response regulator [Spirochaetales bacterium]
GRLSLETIEFDLHKTVEDSVDLVALEAHRKGLEVLIDIGDSIPRFVIGDPIRVRQIIINLFNNAMKFTRQGEIGIKLEAIHREDERVEIRITVRDTGIGIPEEKKGMLFKVFSQVDSSTTRKYGGSGLGLSICRNLVQMMDGTIAVESQEGKGSSFWFVLPFGLGESEILQRKIDAPSLGPQRALVVDDNAGCRYIVESYLSGWGVDVESCGDGAEALVKLRNATRVGEPFTICLIDQFMPGIDGWHLASEINSDTAIQDIPLFLTSPTGKTGDEAKMKLLNWFEGYINKPIKKDEFLEILTRSLTDPEELEPLEDEPAVENMGFSFAGTRRPILVAEDHEVNQQLFRAILQNLGLRVTVAADGFQAVELAKEGASLIFMDVQMPGMNGYEATEKIRSLGIDVPIIAVTASAVKGEKEKAMEIGMTDFLTKPFKKQDLIPVLRKWLPAPTEAIDAAEELPAADSDGLDAEGEIEEHDIFDIDEAVDTFMGNKAMVLDLLNTLIDKSKSCVEEIRAGMDSGDLAQVRSAAHAIKGSSWNLSARRLGDSAAVVEDAAAGGYADVIPNGLNDLQSRLTEFIDYCAKLTEE